jgi:hypothetical protein
MAVSPPARCGLATTVLGHVATMSVLQNAALLAMGFLALFATPVYIEHWRQRHR